MSVEQDHELKETLTVDVITPGHEPRTETALFRRTKTELLEREGHRCWICARTPAETGHPAQVHHFPIERSLATGVDFTLVERDCEKGMYGQDAKKFDWDGFHKAGDVYAFVDNALLNGLVLCPDHHIGRDEGIHYLPHPLWVVQRYLREGYQYTPDEIIHHDEVES